jgi:hypothetical protein
MSNQVDEDIDFGTIENIFPEGQNADTELDFGDPEEENPQATAAPTGVDRDLVYKYLQDNPDEFKAITDIGQKVFREEPKQAPVEPATDGRPDIQKFQTYEEYYEALAEWKVDQRMAKLEPAVRSSTANNTVEEIFRKYNVPEAGKEYLKTALSRMPSDQLAALPDEAKQMLAYSAKGYADEVMPKNGTSKSEPVANAARSGVQIAEGYSKNDVMLYCRTVGIDPASKEGRAELRKEGLIK